MPESFNPEAVANPAVAGLSPYVPGEQVQDAGWTKLNTNENPYPPSPRVGEAIAAETNRLQLYPDPASRALRQAVAHRHGWDPAGAIAGNGSDDLLNLLVRAFGASDRPAGALDPSYSLYPILAAAAGVPFRPVPFRQPFRLPVDDVLASDCRLFFLTCPHAPSGVSFPRAEIEALAGGLDGVLVVDEAYGDFAGESFIAVLDRHPNAIITRSFSKSLGLAGLRVGYGLASPALVGILDRVRDSYNLDRLAQAGAVAAIGDRDYYDAVIGKITYTRDFYRREFGNLGWLVYPSQANFLFVRPERGGMPPGEATARDLFAFLRSRRILVRYFGGHALTRDFLRISVGDEDQMLLLWQSIEEWRQSE